eukprot:gene17733-21144_t
MSPRKSWPRGNTYFWLDATGFNGVPILKLRHTSGTEATFGLNGQLGNIFQYIVPEPPASGSLKRPKSDLYTFEILQSNSRPTTIQGQGFILAPNDGGLQVFFGTTQANVISVNENAIDVDVPNALIAGEVDVTVVLYNGHSIEAPKLFSFVNPILNRVSPARGVSGLQHPIVLTGVNLIDDKHQTFTVVSIGGDLCTNLQWIDEQTVQCDTPIKVVPAGNLAQHPVTMTIRGMAVQSNLMFTVYHPEILRVTPDAGLATGGARVQVTGNYLRDVLQATIGGSLCNIDVLTITDNDFYCTTSPYALTGGNDHETFKLKANFGGMTIEAPDAQQFTYFMPSTTSITPAHVMSKGATKITIQGANFNSVDKINVGAISYTIMSPGNTHDTMYVDVDATQYAVGDIQVTVFIGATASNVMTFKIVEPKIRIPVAPTEGYLYGTTPITIEVENFPVIPVAVSRGELRRNIEFKIGTLTCTDLIKIIGQDKFTCTVPLGAVATGPQIFSFKIFQGNYVSDKTFTFFEPTITAQAQTSSIPRGGGVLTVDGHSYVSATQVNYVGPAIDLIEPRQGSQKRIIEMTISGENFGNNAARIRVTVNGVNCPNVAVIAGGPPFQITCDKPISATSGAHAVVVSVDANTGAGFVDSMDAQEFTNNRLGCLGLPEPDGSNAPVPWWFTYKLKGPFDFTDYLYQDPETEELEYHEGLSATTGPPYSPLAASFDQYNDGYNYLFFNDQPGGRDVGGARIEERGMLQHKHGHVKGMVYWEEDPITGAINGINIQHSNPHLPAYQALNVNTFHDVDSDLQWLGAPDYNQHFFCHEFNNLDSIAEYYFKTEANLIANYHVPAMNLWSAAKKNQYPYLYDLMTLYEGYPVRVPNIPAGNLPVMTVAGMKTTCENAIHNTVNLLNICYWQSPMFQIGGMDAHMFTKMGIDYGRVAFPAIAAVHPPALSRYIVANLRPRIPRYDGLDLWRIIASTYQRKYFVEFFIQNDCYEEIYNVGLLHISPNFATQHPPNNMGHIQYSAFEFSGKSTEHAKIGWPVYPTYGANANNPNENFFCVGDLNRHNGQAGRGGGSICFQNPKLVYQFNRFVHSYMSRDVATGHPQHYPAHAIQLFTAISQPIKLQRGAWVNDVEVELKDIIGGVHNEQVPRNLQTIDATTVANPDDVISTFNALRTNVLAANVGNDISLIPLAGPALPAQPDLFTYVADDTFSLHYNAFDNFVGAICDTSPAIFAPGGSCNEDTCMSTLLAEVGFAGVPVLPNANPSAYA